VAFPQVGVEAVIKGLQKYLTGMTQIDNANKKAGKGADKSTGFLNKFGKALVNVGKVAALAAIAGVTAASVALVKFGKSSITVARGFEDSMAVLGVAASSTGLTVEELGDISIAVGADTRILGASASGAGKAMTGLFKSGLTTTEVFGDLNGFMNEGAELGGALRASFDLAAASELDVAQASDLASIAISTFGADLETAEERANFINFALNNMAMAADASVANVPDMVEALRMVAPTAGAMKIPIEDVNNALAILSTRGITGSMAGTSLNSMLTSLQAPTEMATKWLDALGIDVRDATTGEMLPAVEIIGQFETALGGASAAERDAALASIFTIRGLRAMNVLQAEGVIGWNDMVEATANAATIQEQAAARGATFSGAMEALNGTIETLQIVLGSVLLPILADLARSFADFIAQHIPAIEAGFEAVVGWLGEKIPAAIEIGATFWENTLLPAIQAVSDFISGTVAPVVANVIAWFGENLPAALQNTADFWDAVLLPIVQAYADYITGTLAPIVMDIITWFADNIPTALETSGSFWETTLLPAMATVSDFIANTLIPTISDVVTWFADNIPVALQAAATIWEGTLLPAITTVADFMTGTVAPIVQNIITWFETNIPAALEAAAVVWENTLLPAVETVVKFFTDTVNPAVQDIIAWFETNIPTALDEAAFAWRDTLLPAIETVIDFFNDSVMPVVDEVTTFIVEQFDTVVSWFEENWPLIQETADTVLSKIQENIDVFVGVFSEILEPAIDSVITWFETNFPLIQNTVETVINFIIDIVGVWVDMIMVAVGLVIVAWEALTPAIDNVWNIIKTIVETAINTVLGIIETVMLLINGDWEGAWESIKTVASDIWDGITTIVTEFIEGVMNVMGTTLEDVAADWGGAWEGMKTAFNTTWLLIKTAVDTKLTALKKLFTDFPDKLSTVGQSIVDAIKTGIENAWQGLVDFFSGKLQDLADKLPFSEPKDTSSPLFGLSKAGEAFIHNFMGGIEDATPDLLQSVFSTFSSVADAVITGLESKRFDIANLLTGDIGKALGVGKFFIESVEAEIVGLEEVEGSSFAEVLIRDRRILLQQRDALDKVNNRFKATVDLQEQAIALGFKNFDFTTATDIDLLRLSQRMAEVQGDLLDEQLLTAEELTAEAEKYAEQQERIARAQQAQQDMAFLEQQLQLLDLITEHGLDAGDILGGLELGLDADMNDLAAAMITGMEMVVAATEDALGIASPSKVMMKIGTEIDAGVAEGILSGMGAPVGAMQLLSSQLVNAPMQAASAGVTNFVNQGDTNVSMDFGKNQISGDVGLKRFEGVVRRIVRQEVGGRG